LIKGNINIQAVVHAGKLKYRYATLDIQSISAEKKLQYFRIWVEKNGLSKKPFIEDEKNKHFSGMGILFRIQAIVGKVNSKEKNGNSDAFQLPVFLGNVAWLAPIRTDPKRTYDSYKITFNPDGT